MGVGKKRKNTIIFQFIAIFLSALNAALTGSCDE
jgi:hypothetical protein